MVGRTGRCAPGLASGSRFPSLGVLGILALSSSAMFAGCDRRGPEPAGTGTSSLTSAPTAASPSTASSSASPPAASLSVTPASAAHGADCAPLERPPTTTRQELVLPGKYHARASYPSVLSSDPALDKEVNAAIAKDLAKRQRSFAHDADEAIAESKEDDEPLKPQGMDQKISCQDDSATTTILSVECTSSSNLGGAHPQEEHFTYNFALCAGKRVTPLTLDAICKPGVPCKKAITRALQQKLSTGPTKGIELDLDDLAEALKRFAITRTGLRFFANDDLPTAVQSAGTIDIPFSQLAGVLRNDGPLLGLVAP